jgi:hypothetical protein
MARSGKTKEINDTNARVQLSNGKIKILNIMRLKKFFSYSTNENFSENNDFKIEPNITGLITRAMKKLMQPKDAAQLAINVLCNLTKKHCSMCEWIQECSDNRLLFDPTFTR